MPFLQWNHKKCNTGASSTCTTNTEWRLWKCHSSATIASHEWYVVASIRILSRSHVLHFEIVTAWIVSVSVSVSASASSFCWVHRKCFPFCSFQYPFPFGPSEDGVCIWLHQHLLQVNQPSIAFSKLNDHPFPIGGHTVIWLWFIRSLWSLESFSQRSTVRCQASVYVFLNLSKRLDWLIDLGALFERSYCNTRLK